MDIIERTRFNGNAIRHSDSIALQRWFNRAPRKTIELRPQIRKIHDTIDFDDEVQDSKNFTRLYCCREICWAKCNA